MELVSYQPAGLQRHVGASYSRLYGPGSKLGPYEPTPCSSLGPLCQLRDLANVGVDDFRIVLRWDVFDGNDTRLTD